MKFEEQTLEFLEKMASLKWALYFCSVCSIYHNNQTNKAVKVWSNDVKVVRSNFLFDDEMSHQSESVVSSPLLQSLLNLIKLTKLREFVF